MNILKISSNSYDEVAQNVSNHIKAGYLTVIPSDTAYALSTNALDEVAIKKLYKFKQRNSTEPIHIFLGSVEQIEQYADVSLIQMKILKKFLPGPYTFILKKKDIIPPILTAGLPTIGIRIPNNNFISSVCHYSGVPFTATSSNRSGYPTAYSLDELINQYDEDYLNENISCIVESENSTIGKESSIVDITNAEFPKILRKGAVDESVIISGIKEILS